MLAWWVAGRVGRVGVGVAGLVGQGGGVGWRAGWDGWLLAGWAGMGQLQCKFIQP